MTTAATHAAPALGATLQANLRALAVRNPRLAAVLRDARPRHDLEFIETEQGESATLDGRSLASRRKPLDEASRLADSIDLASAGAFVFLGFGLGHHVAEFALKAGRRALIVVFEPDVSLLRDVLSRIDHSAWIARTNSVFLSSATDGGAIASAIEGAEPILAMGVKFIEHPPSRRRLAGQSKPFTDAFTAAMSAVRTVVVTTMVQTETTLRNALANLPHYLRGASDSAAGITDLANLCAGKPAVVVSAGPSLARNIEQLKRDGLRDRCVIIAVQTALKPLLARGVKPHFVTALDYHEISKRFYEGLTPDDLEGVTLIAEPKVHPSVPNAFAGAIRCPADESLDVLLGDEFAGEHGRIKAGSTVAHLAYYLARHMGCSPVTLVGQDLAFTDGQYYASGAAIHETWAPEINPFTTLEMFEWERIVRGRATLREGRDHLGRPVYTDEQMWTYHSQFEREFLADSAAGVQIIDATEGGLAKAHATAMTLAEALDRFAPESAAPLPTIPAPTSHKHGKNDSATRHIANVRRDVGRIATLSRDTARLLTQLQSRLGDASATEKFIRRIYANRDEATAIRPAYDLVHRLNQTGAFNRARADREIDLASDLSPIERQKRQIERDIRNVHWLADAADSLATMLDDALVNLRGDGACTPSVRTNRVDPGAPPPPPVRLAGVVIDEPNLDAGALKQTVTALNACTRLENVLILTDDDARTRARLAGASTSIVRTNMGDAHQRLNRIRRLRAFSPHAWRGGVGAMVWADEALAPKETLEALQSRGLTGAFVVDPRRPNLRSDLCDAVIARHVDDPVARPLTFTQAPPGVCGFVVDQSILADISSAITENSPFAHLGGVLRYNPRRPAYDPIAKSVCVAIDAETRNAPAQAPAEAPQHLVLELTTESSAAGGLRSGWRGSILRARMDTKCAQGLVDQFARRSPHGALTLAGRGDPLLHPDALEIIRAAREAGVYAIHVRTDLVAPEKTVDAFIETGVDVVSVDLRAATRETYAQITGNDAFGDVSARFDRLCRARTFVGGVASPWIVPRITRCDATYAEIERFYDAWTLLLGGCVIDPMPSAMEGGRIAPLALPQVVVEQQRRSTMCVRADGTIVDGSTDLCPGNAVGSIERGTLTDGWRALLKHRGVNA